MAQVDQIRDLIRQTKQEIADLERQIGEKNYSRMQLGQRPRPKAEVVAEIHDQIDDPAARYEKLLRQAILAQAHHRGRHRAFDLNLMDGNRLRPEVLAYLLRDELKARIQALADAMPEFAQALTNDELEAKTQRIKDEVANLSRQREQVLEELKNLGIH